MSREVIVFLKDQLIDPAILPAVSERDGFFDVIRKATLESFKPLVWSSRSQRWVYVFYDDAEATSVRKLLGPVDGLTLKEMYLMKSTQLAQREWSQIFAAKSVFSATIREVSDICYKKEIKFGKAKQK